MALLVVVTTLMVVSVLVTELAYTARVRQLVAAHRRDRVQAYWLARSGINLYRLLLSASKQLEKNETLSQYAELLGLNIGDALWQLLPVINTGLLRGLLGAEPGADEEEVAEMARQRRLSDEVERRAEERLSLFSDRSFLDFDGDFSAEVTDHESRINVNYFAMEGEVASLQESATAQMLYQLMSGEENDQWFYDRNIDRWEIIGNLKDWVDSDSYRSGGLGGYEDNLYNALDPPYLSKNAPFDTLEELRLVAGWEGAVFDRFRDSLTVYGSSFKINVNNANDLVLSALIRACAPTPPTSSDLELCFDQPTVLLFRGTWGKASEFVQTLQDACGIELDESCIEKSVTTSSKTFTIRSTGLVGTSAVTITAVYDFSSSTKGKLLYWRVE